MKGLIYINCCICGQRSVLQEVYHNAPHHLMSIYDSKQLDLKDLQIYYCSFCGHTQIPTYVNDQYYEDYSMGSYWGASFKRTREQQIERLATLLPVRKRFLDIGCGVGHYLELARVHFEELFGVEPSGVSARKAQEKEFKVINDYFHEEIKFEHGFDAISIIEVLEHLEEPVAFLKRAARFLNDHGILLVEVPNGQRIVEKRLYYNLCTDHIQYFSINSLIIMAQKAGLTVICAQEAADPNLLELYVRKSTKSDGTFGERRQSALEELVSQLQFHTNIAAWGAGAESACFLAMLQDSVNIDCIFDSDQAKHGHHIGAIPILKPTCEEVSKYEIIVLFANAHRLQIQEQLQQLGFTGKLITFKV